MRFLAVMILILLFGFAYLYMEGFYGGGPPHGGPPGGGPRGPPGGGPHRGPPGPPRGGPRFGGDPRITRYIDGGYGNWWYPSYFWHPCASPEECPSGLCSIYGYCIPRRYLAVY